MSQHTYGPYTPDILLASGKTSEVWQARGPKGDVALKIAQNDEARDRLRDEAELLRSLQFKGVSEVLEGAPDHSWMALRLVDGQPFDRWALSRATPEILAAARSLLDTLHQLHLAGWIHGDVKPANVIVSAKGAVTLIDFSISGRVGSGGGQFAGTPGYMAPERIDQGALSAGTDVYGAGAMLYAALTGRTPFSTREPTALTYLPLVSLPTPPSSWRPDISAQLGRLLLSMLAFRPEMRPRDLRRLGADLEESAAGPPAPPLLGMEEERELLRRAVVGTLAGEPRIAVIYGPAGTGRKTLITEAVYAARREGMPYLKGMKAEAYHKAIQSSKLPPVLVLTATQRGAVALAKAVLASKRQALIFLLSSHPLPDLQGPEVVQLTPSALSLEQARQLCSEASIPPDQVTALWEESLGIPGYLHAALRRELRARGAQVDGTLPPELLKLKELLTGGDEVSLDALAQGMELDLLELVDLSEMLLLEGIATCSSDGTTLRLVGETRP
ncbi:MAG: serine/threonine-protein kinase PknK [Deltaproteobacteria bacterium]|nr:serine/threonine-protein kinase PknK [Deltaproteobacteria bacterium]